MKTRIKDRMVNRREINFQMPGKIERLREKTIKVRKSKRGQPPSSKETNREYTEKNRYQIDENIRLISEDMKKQGIGTIKNPVKVTIFGGGCEAIPLNTDINLTLLARSDKFLKTLGYTDAKIKEMRNAEKEFQKLKKIWNPRSYQDIELLGMFYENGLNAKITVTDCYKEVTKLHKWKDKQEYMTAGLPIFPIKRKTVSIYNAKNQLPSKNNLFVLTNTMMYFPKEYIKTGITADFIDKKIVPGGYIIMKDYNTADEVTKDCLIKKGYRAIKTPGSWKLLQKPEK